MYDDGYERGRPFGIFGSKKIANKALGILNRTDKRDYIILPYLLNVFEDDLFAVKRKIR